MFPAPLPTPGTAGGAGGGLQTGGRHRGKPPSVIRGAQLADLDQQGGRQNGRSRDAINGGLQVRHIAGSRDRVAQERKARVLFLVLKDGDAVIGFGDHFLQGDHSADGGNIEVAVSQREAGMLPRAVAGD
jgi:hypothetical protein